MSGDLGNTKYCILFCICCVLKPTALHSHAEAFFSVMSFSFCRNSLSNSLPTDFGSLLKTNGFLQSNLPPFLLCLEGKKQRRGKFARKKTMALAATRWEWFKMLPSDWAGKLWPFQAEFLEAALRRIGISVNVPCGKMRECHWLALLQWRNAYFSVLRTWKNQLRWEKCFPYFLMCEFFCPSGKGAPNQKKLWGNIACFLYKCSLMTYQRIAPILMSPLHTPNHTGAEEQVRTRCGAAALEVELVWARTEQSNSFLNGTVDSTSAPQFRRGSERVAWQPDYLSSFLLC